MAWTPLLLGEKEKAALRGLRERAAKNPLDMPTIAKEVQHLAGAQRHQAQMKELTIDIPFGYWVTFSIERYGPGDTCRHMSMSSPGKDRAPLAQALWMVAEELGFNGGFSACCVWQETLPHSQSQRNIAINLMQPITIMPTNSDESD